MEDRPINERSYGVVPLKIYEKTPYLFLIQHRSGAWLLPKGHVELGETDRQAAERELREETGLLVKEWLDHEPFIEHYEFWRGDQKIYKEATYFPAFVSGEVRLQRTEVDAGQWIVAKDAPSQVTFPEMKKIVEQVYSWINSRS